MNFIFMILSKEHKALLKDFMEIRHYVSYKDVVFSALYWLMKKHKETDPFDSDNLYLILDRFEHNLRRKLTCSEVLLVEETLSIGIRFGNQRRILND